MFSKPRRSLSIPEVLVCSFVFLSMILVAACTPAETPSPTPTATPRPTDTPLTPTPTPSPTDTPEPPTPTNTPTPLPTDTSTPVPTTSVLIPLDMLPGPPGSTVNILGADCFYQRDSWGDKAAIIEYECPDLNKAFLSVRFTNLEEGETATDLFGKLPPEGFTPIEPSDRFSDEGDTIAAGLIGNSGVAYYFTVFETENFVISIESSFIDVSFSEQPNTSLDDFYRSDAEEIINAVLQIMLDNTKMGTKPLPTLSAEEQLVADEFGSILVSEEFLHTMLDEDLVLTRYQVDYFDGDDNMPGMCQTYSSSLRTISNCVNFVGSDFDLDYVAQWYSPDWEIQPTISLEKEVSFYGFWDDSRGSWVIQGYMLAEDYLFYAHFDGIHIGMGASIEDAITGYVDDYISDILRENLAKLQE